MTRRIRPPKHPVTGHPYVDNELRNEWRKYRKYLRCNPTRNTLPGLLDHIDRLTRRLEIYEARLGRVARSHPEAYAEALAGDAQ